MKQSIAALALLSFAVLAFGQAPPPRPQAPPVGELRWREPQPTAK